MNRQRLGPMRGFSLLEVIVALVVISAFGAALFTWAGQTLQTVSRAGELWQQTEVERNVTELAFSLNPGERPVGDLQTVDHRYHWDATPVQGPNDQVERFSGIGPYQVAVYRVRFRVAATADPAAAELVTERLVAGYRLVRALNAGPPGLHAPGGGP